MKGLSVVIPFGGRARLKLLDAVLRSLRACGGVDQIVVSELGRAAVAAETAARWAADYIFTLGGERFNKCRAMNAGARLARQPEILWLDGDLVFGPDFVIRALAEFRAAGLDHLYPFTGIHYLREAATAAVLDGTPPWQCQAGWVLGPLHGGAPGGMSLIQTAFFERHGGMIETFEGWGGEDHAWIRKVSLLGRLGVTALPDQPAWHLYHADSGSNDARSSRAKQRDNASNVALGYRIEAIETAAEFNREFPPPPPAPPWPAGTRVAFVLTDAAPAALAADWAAQLARVTGVAPPIVTVPAAGAVAAAASLDAAALFAGPTEAAAILEADSLPPALVLVAPPPLARPRACPGWVLARDAAEAQAWREAGAAVWHRPWDEGDEAALPSRGAPVVLQPLSELLGRPRHWSVAIPLERAALPPAALVRPLVWVVAFQDVGGVEIARQDANHRELHRLLLTPAPTLVIDRRVTAMQRPATWSVWLSDRAGTWLGQLSGPAYAVPCRSTS